MTFEKDKIICEEVSYDKHKVKHFIPGKFDTIEVKQEKDNIQVILSGTIEYDKASIEVFRNCLLETNKSFEGTGLRYHCPKCNELNLISNLTKEGEIFNCRNCNTELLKQIGETSIELKKVSNNPNDDHGC